MHGFSELLHCTLQTVCDIMNDKLSILTQLIKMARTDEKVREIEYNFILAVAEMFDIEKDHVDVLFEEYIEFDPPKGIYERIEQFHALVLLANVDRHIDEREIEFLHQCGLRLGLRPEAVDNVLNEMEKHENGMIPADTMMRIFQVYQN